jgi:hypothetical protein
MFSGKLPVLVRVTACEELEVPTGWDENVRVETDSAATAPAPMPLKLMLCGDPAALSVTVIDPDRSPAVVGSNTTVRAQAPAGGTLFPQSFVWEKSPAAVIDVIVSGELPAFRKSTLCAALVVPGSWLAYERTNGLAVKADADAGEILTKNALLVPFSVS